MADFDVVGRMVVDDEGATSKLGEVGDKLEEAESKTNDVSAATSALGQVANFVWAQLIVKGIEAAVGAISNFLSGTLDAATESQDAIAQLNNVIASTGGAAGLTSQQLQDMATGLMNVTTFGDEAAMSAETILLQFDKIGKDTFPAALQATADLATRLGVDLPQAATMVGRALANPEEGIGRLNTAFKIFDKDQQKVIEDLAAHGKIQEAQALILEGLNKKVGGAAAAAASTFSGQWKQFQNQLGEAQESIGKMFLPALSELVSMLGPVLLNALQSVMPALQTVANLFQSLVLGAKAGVPPLENLRRNFLSLLPPEARTAVDNFLKGLSEKLGPSFAQIGKSLETIGVQLVAFWQNHGDQIIAIVGEAFTIIAGVITGVLQFIAGVLAAVTAAMNGNWNTALASLVGGAVGFVDTIAGLFGGSAAGIAATWSGIWSNLGIIVSAVWNNIISSVMGFFAGIGKSLSQGGSSIGSFFTGLANSIGTAFTSLMTSIGNAILDMLGPEVVSALNGLATSVGTLLGLLPALAAKIFGDLVSTAAGLLDQLNTIVSAAFSAILTVVTPILNAVVGVVGSVFQAIVGVVSSVVGTVVSVWSAGWSAVSGAVTPILASIMSAVGNFAGQIKTGIANALNDAIAAAKAVAAGAAGVGQSMVDGIVAGIKGAAASVLHALKGIVDAAIEAIKKSLGIASPSQVMAQEVGHPIVQGIAAGIAALSDLPGLTLNQMVVPQLVGAGPGSSTVNNQASYTYNFGNNIYGGNGQSADLLQAFRKA